MRDHNYSERGAQAFRLWLRHGYLPVIASVDVECYAFEHGAGSGYFYGSSGIVHGVHINGPGNGSGEGEFHACSFSERLDSRGIGEDCVAVAYYRVSGEGVGSGFGRASEGVHLVNSNYRPREDDLTTDWVFVREGDGVGCGLCCGRLDGDGVEVD